MPRTPSHSHIPLSHILHNIYNLHTISCGATHYAQSYYSRSNLPQPPALNPWSRPATHPVQPASVHPVHSPGLFLDDDPHFVLEPAPGGNAPLAAILVQVGRACRAHQEAGRGWVVPSAADGCLTGPGHKHAKGDDDDFDIRRHPAAIQLRRERAQRSAHVECIQEPQVSEPRRQAVCVKKWLMCASGV
jgi:hypothetical protein